MQMATEEIEARVRACRSQLNECLAKLPEVETPVSLMSYRENDLAVKWDNSNSPPWEGEWTDKDN